MTMTTNEHRVYHRHPFTQDGKMVARRELKFGTTTYQPSQELPSAAELGLDARMVRILWEQHAIDTYAPGSERVLVEGQERWIVPRWSADLRPGDTVPERTSVKELFRRKREKLLQPGAAPHTPMVDGKDE